uniref:CX domain-containing protein n=1 Tax=Panagrolaimus sp. JU765 TaxID=591449 RepID=A0AC34RRC7_9BILA
MYRVKFPDEIFTNMTKEFEKFIEKNQFTKAVSEATNITYWIVDDGSSFIGIKNEPDLCIHNVENGFDSDGNGKVKKMKMYFFCDEYCCADECCGRDWPLTIIGIICGSLFVVTPIYCIMSCVIANLTRKKRQLNNGKSENGNEYTGFLLS